MTDLKVRQTDERQQSRQLFGGLGKLIAGGVSIFVVAVAIVAGATIGGAEPVVEIDGATQAEINRIGRVVGSQDLSAGWQAYGDRYEALAGAQAQAFAELTAERSLADADLELSIPGPAAPDQVWKEFLERSPAVNGRSGELDLVAPPPSGPFDTERSWKAYAERYQALAEDYLDEEPVPAGGVNRTWK